MPNYRPKTPSYRRKFLPFAIAASLSGPVMAMGIGDIQLQSFLGAPLQAEIPLNHLEEVSADQLKVRIGSEADYTALGVDYSYAHSQFKIEPIIKNGRGYVRISTREPVSEPYLNFVLNVRWPQGQLVREFTVLLDPAPVTAVAGANSSQANSGDGPATETAAASRSSEPSVAAAAELVPVSKPRTQRHREAITDGYVTHRGDSLWRIANQMRPANVPTEQMMNAILAANPAAFIDGDAARLKEAATLSMPSAEQIAAAANSAATATLAATAAPASTPALHKQPNATAIAAVELQLENALLKSQVEDLTGNVTTLNDNLQQSEQRLHQLEAQLSDLLLQFQQQRATVAALNGTSTTNEAAPPARSVGSMISQVNAADLQPAPAPLPSWWVHLLYWLGIGAAAMWAIREHFWPRRFATVDISSNAVNPSVERNVVARTEWRTPAEDARHRQTPAPVTIEELVAGPVAEEDAPEVSRTIDDPVDASISAGVFVAFGRFDEAERLLLQAIEQAPERTDLKLQLLDVYTQADRADAFEALAADIERDTTNPEVIAELAVLRENFSNKH